MYEEFLEAIGADILGLLAASITDARVQWDTLEVASDIGIDTAWSSPAGLAETVESVRMGAEELLCSLFENGRAGNRSWHDERWYKAEVRKENTKCAIARKYTV